MFKTWHNCIIKFPSWYFTLGSQNSNKREREREKKVTMETTLPYS